MPEVKYILMRQPAPDSTEVARPATGEEMLTFIFEFMAKEFAKPYAQVKELSDAAFTVRTMSDAVQKEVKANLDNALFSLASEVMFFMSRF